LAANVQLQDVCLALDIVQQKTIQVKVECTISFSSQKFDEKGGRAAAPSSAVRALQAESTPQTARALRAESTPTPHARFKEKSGTCKQIPD